MDRLSRRARRTDEVAEPMSAGLAARPIPQSILHRNLSAEALYRVALERGEGRVSREGALVVDTGSHTGRSPRDKYIVREAETEDSVDWTNSGIITREAFDRLEADVLAHVRGRGLFVQELFAGADVRHQIGVTVYTELAWHALFMRNLLIRERVDGAAGDQRNLTIFAVPRFRADPRRHGVRSPVVIACDLARGVVLIGGTAYAGEMKKAVFTFLNFILPKQGVLPMHCSANVGQGGDTALFFGLSGTGKTTLSATSDRTLIGDDEHGWSADGIFNFEGGCYAKVIGLSFDDEPQIHLAANRFGAVLENVAISDVTGEPDFNDNRRTENTRAAYPLRFIANASTTGRAGHPANIVMLTTDAFGVLPPIARLTPDQAVYHFLSGFTAKIAGTERGVRDPEPTFSACFGAPFMPRAPVEYGDLLRRMLAEHGSACWLVNTGWTGGPFGIGRRLPLQWTRTLLSAALDGTLARGAFRVDDRFGFEVPLATLGLPSDALTPRDTWQDGAAFDSQAERLVRMFLANFAKFGDRVDSAIIRGGPRHMIV